MPERDDPVRIAVVGYGHLGRHHARLLSANPRARLVGVVDPRPEARAAAAEALGCPVFAGHRDLIGEVEAACVVVPTSKHAEVGEDLLAAGVDVLVEKPIAMTVAQGQGLVDLARESGRILQVGHIERFNAAVKALHRLDFRPRYIESQRLGALTFRSMDVGVVLDLMIHDLDLVLSLIGSPVRSVRAFGGAVFTPAEDMASAVLEFENGAVAHLTASRVALRAMRRMRLFAKDGYAGLDFQDSNGVLIRKGAGWDLQKLDVSSIDPSKIENLWKFVFEGLLSLEQFKLDEGNPLAEELDAFVTAVRDRSRPVVSGEDGVAALALAHRILAAIEQHPW